MSSVFVMALGMLLLWLRDRSQNLRDWTLGIGFAALGNIASGMAGQIGGGLPFIHDNHLDDVFIIGGFVAITAGYVLLLRGIYWHFRLPWPRACWLLVIASGVLYLCFIGSQWEHPAWAIITLWSRAIICAIGITVFVQQRRNLSTRVAIMTIGPLLFQGPYVFVRGLVYLFPPQDPLLQWLLSAPITYMVTTLSTLAVMLGLLILYVETLLGQLQEAANTDTLTGLHNRRSFNLLAGHEIDKALRTRAPLWLLIIDIDHFKSINDEYGHSVGDWVLQETGALFRNVVRKSDIVARYGGEEFCVVLPETDELQASAMARRIFEAVHTIRRSREADAASITVSIGAAGLQAADGDGDGLVKRADVALYQAKNTGRNRIVGLPSSMASVVKSA